MTKHLLTFKSWTKDEIHHLLSTAQKLKKNEIPSEGLLQGKTLGMIFEKPSNRTRLSFEVGLHHMGGKAIYIKADEVGMGERESIEDVARVFSRYLDGVLIRNNDHNALESFSTHSDIPVINGLTDLYHPCQALADLLTIAERKKDLDGLKLCYVGDGNNVARSLLEICAPFNINVTLCNPEGYDITGVEALTYTQSRNPQEAVKNADIVYTDVWTSMGQEAEKERRLNNFKGFQINTALLSLAKPDVIFMHCLPAHRGEEVDFEVIDAPQSVIFDQAENRLHAEKAIMLELMGNHGQK